MRGVVHCAHARIKEYTLRGRKHRKEIKHLSKAFLEQDLIIKGALGVHIIHRKTNLNWI